MDTDLRQGPAAGRTRPATIESFEDPTTGATVRRLTNTPDAGNWHLYFTENGWYDDGRRLLFRSDRDGPVGLYSIDLESEEITQLTDLPEDVEGVTRVDNHEIALFWCGDRLASLDLESLEVRTLYERPEGYRGSHTAGTADGERVVTSISEETPELDAAFDSTSREEWIAARMEARPHSQVLSVPLAVGDGEGGHDGDEAGAGELEPTVHVDEARWLNHVNASPTRPELVTYCEEGTWEEVDRIWVLDLETDETWRIRPTEDGEAVGHEYWLEDGEYVGYHGWHGPRDDPDAFFGQVRYDDADRREWPAPDVFTHFHSNTRELVVGDGTHRGAPYDLLWRWDDEREGYDGPWMLASHGWEGDHDAHPHSRLAPDDSRVVFDSSRDGTDATSDVYLVDVPDDLESLPRFDDEAFEPTVED